MDESRHLQLDYRADDGTVVIGLAGELDIASAPELEQAIDRAIASGARLVIVDLGAGSSSWTPPESAARWWHTNQRWSQSIVSR